MVNIAKKKSIKNKVLTGSIIIFILFVLFISVQLFTRQTAIPIDEDGFIAFISADSAGYKKAETVELNVETIYFGNNGWDKVWIIEKTFVFVNDNLKYKTPMYNNIFDNGGKARKLITQKKTYSLSASTLPEGENEIIAISAYAQRDDAIIGQSDYLTYFEQCMDKVNALGTGASINQVKSTVGSCEHVFVSAEDTENIYVIPEVTQDTDTGSGDTGTGDTDKGTGDTDTDTGSGDDDTTTGGGLSVNPIFIVIAVMFVLFVILMLRNRKSSKGKKNKKR